MNVQEVYKRYNIMPNLQQHQLRTAGVGYLLAEHCKEDVDLYEIVVALLLHDLGNISKFNLDRFPEFLKPEGKAYWAEVKANHEKKYGKLPHKATVKMCKELGVSQRVIELIDAISFNQEQKNYRSPDYSKKICAYADMRVAPHGVTSLEERLEDARVRYHREGEKDTYHYVMRAFLIKIEKQLAEVVDLPLDEITEEKVAALFPELREWEIDKATEPSF